MSYMLKFNLIKKVGLKLVTSLYYCGRPKENKDSKREDTRGN